MMEKIKAVAREYLKDSAHDFAHTLRVYKNCLIIAEDMPSVDLELLSVASLLHDVAKVKEDEDATGKTDHAVLGAQMALQILLELGFGEEFARKVSDIISTHRFRADNPPQTLEAKILFDADKLDVTGALGIARTLMYKGDTKDVLYRRKADGSVDDGTGDLGDSFFREYKFKLEKLYDRFYTVTGTRLARQRQRIAADFYRSLLEEVTGPGVERLSEILEG